ncbi:cytochrome P450 [Sphingomonas sp. CGMCC 1.13654]|uniref:Cytochrome P450 n=1 Tax=Sphingomonas chungangi TaxID=2683589 RepID=A0A838KZT7_9SPHN|nr:cytochrome P450 [Sphingomonas chungangi]MBA2932474.1 cytochrome P450 [Sphingomonas chungangi]MVW56097.1 cytochrome P450 [Sphingomonas chungangi]
MDVQASAQSRPRVPDDIARIVISPKSYANDDVIYPAFKWLRENMPLGVAEVEGYDPIWLVTKHADIRMIERNSKLFHNADFNAILTERAGDEFTRSINNGSLKVISSLTYMDPPEHGAFRTITSNWFLPGRISKLKEQIRALARQSVEHLLSFDGECDFVKDFALHYPLRVIMTLFGVPPEDEPMMLKLTQEFFGVHDPEEQRPEMVADPVAAAKMWYASLQDFYAYFDKLSEDRRREPKDDLLSLIANSTVNGQPIPRDEANGYYVAIATAGHDTTSSSTAGGMHGLIGDPEQFALAKSDPTAISGLVDEAIRWTSPVKHFMRNSTEATEVRGQAIGAMERLMMCYPSGNRDEEVFEDPNRFDIRRSPNLHVAFGFGPHMCLGQHLAKLEMSVLFEELLPRLKSVELAGDPRFVETNFVGGYKSLPIRFEKA